MQVPVWPPSGSVMEESDAPATNPFMAVFNNLVVFDQAVARNSPESIGPDLATRWDWSEDGRTLTFKLRSGVRWHDGKLFTAADVKRTWDAITGRRNIGLRKNPRKGWYANVQEVTQTGELEVAFRLERPQPSLLSLVASGVSPVYPCHVDARTMRTKPIGTGPFKVAEIKTNDVIRLIRNPDYWKPGLPYLDGIDWKMIQSESTAVLAFTAGRLDIMRTTVPQIADVQAQAPTILCSVEPTNVHSQVLVNRDAPPFNDPQIRRALALALDRKAFVDTFSQGRNLLGGALLPPPTGAWGAGPADLAGLPGFGTDLATSRREARQLMADAGYGPAKPLKVKIVVRDRKLYQDLAVLLASQLREINIEADLDVLESSLWFSTMARNNFSLSINTYGAAVDDSDVVFYENYACGSQRNYSNICDRGLPAKIDAQSAVTDPVRRHELVQQLDVEIQKEGLLPVLSYTVGGMCWQPVVQGYTPSSNGNFNNFRMEDVWLKRTASP